LLTDATGFPLMVNAFEGNTAETATMLPTIQAFMKAHQLPDVTIVADAGMVSAANQKAIEAAGLSFILGALKDATSGIESWATCACSSGACRMTRDGPIGVIDEPDAMGRAK
jgi:transposase